MHEDEDAVGGALEVNFHDVHADFDGVFESGDGVFGLVTPVAAVGDDEDAGDVAREEFRAEVVNAVGQGREREEEEEEEEGVEAGEGQGWVWFHGWICF
jgi:hypothetical protein